MHEEYKSNNDQRLKPKAYRNCEIFIGSPLKISGVLLYNQVKENESELDNICAAVKRFEYIRLYPDRYPLDEMQKERGLEFATKNYSIKQ